MTSRNKWFPVSRLNIPRWVTLGESELISKPEEYLTDGVRVRVICRYCNGKRLKLGHSRIVSTSSELLEANRDKKSRWYPECRSKIEEKEARDKTQNAALSSPSPPTTVSTSISTSTVTVSIPLPPLPPSPLRIDVIDDDPPQLQLQPPTTNHQPQPDEEKRDSVDDIYKWVGRHKSALLSSNLFIEPTKTDWKKARPKCRFTTKCALMDLVHENIFFYCKSCLLIRTVCEVTASSERWIKQRRNAARKHSGCI